MDICLIETKEGAQIRPSSVHGILWLPTHFENSHWEEIASHQVRLSKLDAKVLSNDAKEAGLTLHFIPALTITRNF